MNTNMICKTMRIICENNRVKKRRLLRLSWLLHFSMEFSIVHVNGACYCISPQNEACQRRSPELINTVTRMLNEPIIFLVAVYGTVKFDKSQSVHYNSENYRKYCICSHGSHYELFIKGWFSLIRRMKQKIKKKIQLYKR